MSAGGGGGEEADKVVQVILWQKLADFSRSTRLEVTCK
jgi:hypothetical protein